MTGRRFSAVVRDAATSAKSISRSRSRANFDTVKSVSNGQIRDRDALQIPRAYKDTMKVAHMRERLLADARRYSPISLVLNLQKLPQTIFSRLIFFPIVWILMLTYAAVAVLTRMGYIDIAAYVGDSEEGLDHMGSASVLVTFVVVFFVTFCYNRYFMIYDTARNASSTILDAMVAGRTCLNQNERRTLFVYLNLMHCSAYCALTPVYTKENFMDVFIKEHMIELPPDEMAKAFGKLDDPSGEGASAYQLCAVWAMGVLHTALKRGDLHGEAYKVMSEEVLKSRSLLAALFAYQYQVIPFVYAHLVSLGSFVYLLGVAIVKGVKCTPGSPYLSGLVLPMLSFVLMVVLTVGLIEIGQAIANPWGTDPEDFAVPTFLHTTAKCARVIIESEDIHPLQNVKGGVVDIGDPDLKHLGSECNVSVDWAEEAVRQARRARSSEGGDLGEESAGSGNSGDSFRGSGGFFGGSGGFGRRSKRAESNGEMSESSRRSRVLPFGGGGGDSKRSSRVLD